MSYEAILGLVSQEAPTKDDDPLSVSQGIVRGLLIRLRRYRTALTGDDAARVAKYQERARHAAETFWAEQFVRSRSALPIWRRARFQRRVADAQEAALRWLQSRSGTGKHHDDNQLVQALTALAQEIELAQARRRSVRNLRVWTLKSILLVSVCAGAVAAIFLGLVSGFEPIGTEILRPSAPFREAPFGALSSAPQDLTGYFAEFSSYYFGLSEDFPSHFYPRPDIDKYRWPIDSPGQMDPPAAIDPSASVRKALLRPARHVRSHSTADESSTDRVHRQLWRVILRNRSPYRSQFVGTIRIDLKFLRRLEFPWHLLSVTPDVQAGYESYPWAIELINTGIGPAINLSWSLHTRDGFKLRQGEAWIVHDRKQHVPYLDPDFLYPTREINSWPVSPLVGMAAPSPAAPGSDTSGARDATPTTPVNADQLNTETERSPEARQSAHAPSLLARPIFLRHTSGVVDEMDLERFFVHDGIWYEVIREIDRLAEVTRVCYSTPAVLTINYESLAGPDHERHFAHDLPANVLYYVRTEHLLERDPREKRVETMTYTVQHEVPHSVVSIAQAIVLPSVQPDGIDLLVESFELDVHELTVGESRSQSVEVNQYINPSGQIVLYLLVTDPVNARYHAGVYINGEANHEFTVETFVPPVLRFPGDNEGRKAEVKRLQEVFARYKTGALVSAPAIETDGGNDDK